MLSKLFNVAYFFSWREHMLRFCFFKRQFLIMINNLLLTTGMEYRKEFQLNRN